MIYVNLHPKAEYSMVTFGTGSFVNIRDFVRDVDWLMWEGRRQLMVCNDTDKQKVFCLIQRLEAAGVEVMIRNERPDKEWNHPVYERRSHEELTALEIARREDPIEIQWAKNSIAKDTEMLQDCKDDKYRDLFSKTLSEDKKRLALLQKEEADRIKRIRVFWDEDDEDETVDYFDK